MNIRLFILSAALLLVSAQAAHAGQKIMATGPGSRFYPQAQTLDCNILNANTSDKFIQIDIVDYFGTVVATTGGPVLTPSYTGLTVSDSVGSSSWCRFIVEVR